MRLRVRAATTAGWVAFCFSGVWAVGNVVVGIPGGSSAWNAMVSVAFTGLGALVLTRQPSNRAGLLLIAPVFLPISDGLARFASSSEVGSRPIELWTGWVAEWIWILGFFPLVVLLPFILPDGRLLDAHWRLAYLMGWVVMVAAIVGVAVFAAGQASWAAIYEVVIFFLTGFCSIAGITSLVLRLQRARGQERSQLIWLLLGMCVFGLVRGCQTLVQDLALIEVAPAFEEVFKVVGVVLLLSLPVTWGIAILRYRLVELNPLLHRVLLLVILTTVLTTLYLGLRLLVGPSSVAAVVTAVGLALGTPVLYGWLYGGVSRLVYGRRGSPAEIVAELTRRLAGAPGPVEVLTALADTVHSALPTATVEVVLSTDGQELRRATRGTGEGAFVHVVPLRFQGTELGHLQIGTLGAPDAADVALLGGLSDAAAGAIAAAHHASELQRARQELVIAREQERRRIARDVHDGVGPVLSGLGFTLDALRESVQGNPAAVKVAGQARAQVREAGQLIRRVARELRPTVVDQLGLLPALRELAVQYDGPALHVEIRAAFRAEALNPATEVAAYAIAAEAMTNVARHSAATNCCLELAQRDGALLVIVDDNGIGLKSQAAGIGRTSMRERAEEIGGSFSIGTNALGGVCVEARLPLEQPDLPRTGSTADEGDRR